MAILGHLTKGQGWVRCLSPDGKRDRDGICGLCKFYIREPMPDTAVGLYGKYRVEKVNGKPTGPVFVLAYSTDPHARAALAAYAESCRADFPQLADDLDDERAKYDDPQQMP